MRKITDRMRYDISKRIELVPQEEREGLAPEEAGTEDTKAGMEENKGTILQGAVPKRKLMPAQTLGHSVTVPRIRLEQRERLLLLMDIFAQVA